jgi:hypothetical protein
MKFIMLVGAVALPAALAAGCIVSLDSQGQIAREEKRFTVSGTPAVHVTTFDGSIQIQSWDKPDVLVEIEKRGPTKETVEGLQVTASQDGNTIEVEVRKPRGEVFTGFGFHQSASARLVV